MTKFRVIFLLCITLSLFFVVHAGADDRSITLKGKKVTASSEAVDTKYYALIIGNNDYQYLSKLRTAVRDARDIEKLLKEKYGFHTKLLINATRVDIIKEINNFRKELTESDSFLIYYAGHGEFDKTVDKAYWLPVDARKDSDENWIIADDITTNIKRITSKHILIVSDSCYSGTLTRVALTEMKGSSERDEYLKKMMARPSRTLMASGGNEPVSDSGGGVHSVFAVAFINAFSEVDKPVFTVEELFHGRIKASVAGKSEQLPEYSSIRNSGDDGGDFVFQLASAHIDAPEVKVPYVQREAVKVSIRYGLFNANVLRIIFDSNNERILDAIATRNDNTNFTITFPFPIDITKILPEVTTRKLSENSFELSMGEKLIELIYNGNVCQLKTNKKATISHQGLTNPTRKLVDIKYEYSN